MSLIVQFEIAFSSKNYIKVNTLILQQNCTLLAFFGGLRIRFWSVTARQLELSPYHCHSALRLPIGSIV